MGSRSIRIATSITAAAATIVLLAVVLGVWATVSLIMASATVVVAVAPLARRVREGTFDLVEPIVGGTVMLAVLFGIRPIAMLIAGDFVYRGVNIREGFPWAVALGLLGTASFVALYEWVRLRRLHAPPREPAAGRPFDRRVAYGWVATLTVLSVGLFAFHLSNLGSDLFDGIRLLAQGASPELVSRWAGTSEYLSTSPILAACAATVLGLATGWRLTRVQLLLLLVLIAYPEVVFYLSGARRYMLPTLLVPLVTWMLMSGRRPGRRLLLVVIPVAFLVLATIPFVRWVGTRDNGGAAAPIVEAVVNPARAVYRFVLGPDTNMVPSLAIEVSVLRSPRDFFYGRATFGDLVLAPIPHVIFPDKPITARDELLTRVFGAPCQVSNGVCDDFSIIGTFYQDFWLPGVVVLMGIVGAASGALWSRWRNAPDHYGLLVAVASWAVFVPIIFRAGFMPGFQWWLAFLLPCLLGVWLASRPGKRLDVLKEASLPQ